MQLIDFIDSKKVSARGHFFAAAQTGIALPAFPPILRP
jgi:hypothetical protein